VQVAFAVAKPDPELASPFTWVVVGDLGDLVTLESEPASSELRHRGLDIIDVPADLREVPRRRPG
jgi:hypothetical protein